MKKIGITVQFPDGDISILTNQINLFKKAKINSLEISIYETDVIVGKKINFPELKILKEAVANTDMAYTVHGELSVNLLDQENFEDHKEVLKRDIEVSGEINATHLVTHFGQTTNGTQSGTGYGAKFQPNSGKMGPHQPTIANYRIWLQNLLSCTIVT